MNWIVLGEDKGKIKLVSKHPNENEKSGILPKGSFLTIEDKNSKSKFILRVDESYQNETYKPSPLIADLDLSPLLADQKCQNIVYAYRIKDISDRKDGQIDFIHPQSLARRSNQEEISLALNDKNNGPKVFPATIHYGKNQLLLTENLEFVQVSLPQSLFFHQIQICGKTGLGKTVAMKYLAQYFIEKMEGAVLAINVKDIDFLMMDKPSFTTREENKKEWESLEENPRGIENYTIYYPSNTSIDNYTTINKSICKKITLNVNEIEPEALTGLLQNISDVGSQSFPDIFRYWQKEIKKDNETFNDFISYFLNNEEAEFHTLNLRGDISQVPLHRGTFNNILRNLNSAAEFFDNKGAYTIQARDILYPGKFSVINVSGEKGIQFGSVLLRHLLRKIVDKKKYSLSTIPILVIIDEVHEFYNTESSREALGVLDTICRTGRSQEIGVVFASQSEDDIPKGLSHVINSKIFFRSDSKSKGILGVSINELQSLKAGYAIVNIHDMPYIRIIKFPLSFSGVFEK